LLEKIFTFIEEEPRLDRWSKVVFKERRWCTRRRCSASGKFCCR